MDRDKLIELASYIDVCVKAATQPTMREEYIAVPSHREVALAMGLTHCAAALRAIAGGDDGAD